MAFNVTRCNAIELKLHSHWIGLRCVIARGGIQYDSNWACVNFNFFRWCAIYDCVHADDQRTSAVHRADAVFPGIAVRTARVKFIQIPDWHL